MRYYSILLLVITIINALLSTSIQQELPLSSLQKQYLHLESSIPHDDSTTRLLQFQEGTQINHQNEQAFETLRDGLNTWSNTQIHLGKSSSAQMLQRINAAQRARKQSLDEQTRKYSFSQFEKQLLDKEDITQQIKKHEQAQRNPQTSKLPFENILYFVMAVLFVIYLLKCIIKRCNKKKTRVRVYNEEAETLNVI